jgi:hypothetical protein
MGKPPYSENALPLKMGRTLQQDTGVLLEKNYNKEKQ